VRRGELYRVYRGTRRDPKKSRVFLIVSRQALLDSRFSTVICAPVYSERHGLSTQLPVGQAEGLKHESSIYCDELISLPKSRLADYVGSLTVEQLDQLKQCLRIALDVE
jgi:mRNA interferase MazF